MKAAAIVISILLVIVLLTGAVSTLSSGFTNFEVRSWLDRFAASDEPVIEDPIVEEPIDEDPIIEDPIEDDPIIEDPGFIPSPFYSLKSAPLSFEFVDSDVELLDGPIISWGDNHAGQDGYAYYVYLLNFIDQLEIGSSYNIEIIYDEEVYNYICVWDFSEAPLDDLLSFSYFNESFNRFSRAFCFPTSSGYSNQLTIYKHTSDTGVIYEGVSYSEYLIFTYFNNIEGSPDGKLIINSIKKV